MTRYLYDKVSIKYIYIFFHRIHSRFKYSEKYIYNTLCNYIFDVNIITYVVFRHNKIF